MNQESGSTTSTTMKADISSASSAVFVTASSSPSSSAFVTASSGSLFTIGTSSSITNSGPSTMASTSTSTRTGNNNTSNSSSRSSSSGSTFANRNRSANNRERDSFGRFQERPKPLHELVARMMNSLRRYSIFSPVRDGATSSATATANAGARTLGAIFPAPAVAGPSRLFPASSLSSIAASSLSQSSLYKSESLEFPSTSPSVSSLVAQFGKTSTFLSAPTAARVVSSVRSRFDQGMAVRRKSQRIALFDANRKRLGAAVRSDGSSSSGSGSDRVKRATCALVCKLCTCSGPLTVKPRTPLLRRRSSARKSTSSGRSKLPTLAVKGSSSSSSSRSGSSSANSTFTMKTRSRTAGRVRPSTTSTPMTSRQAKAIIASREKRRREQLAQYKLRKDAVRARVAEAKAIKQFGLLTLKQRPTKSILKKTPTTSITSTRTNRKTGCVHVPLTRTPATSAAPSPVPAITTGTLTDEAGNVYSIIQMPKPTTRGPIFSYIGLFTPCAIEQQRDNTADNKRKSPGATVTAATATASTSRIPRFLGKPRGALNKKNK